MKRISAVLAVLAVAIAASPAAADRGAPGTTFPEQPGSHPSTACAAIASNPGATTAPRAERAALITTGNFVDACFG